MDRQAVARYRANLPGEDGNGQEDCGSAGPSSNSVFPPIASWLFRPDTRRLGQPGFEPAQIQHRSVFRLEGNYAYLARLRGYRGRAPVLRLEPLRGKHRDEDEARFISALNMARERMERAVRPPPEYYDVNNICHVQHTSDGYSKQVMPPPFKAFDRPEGPSDDTMILLDVSGSMDFTPQSPIYDRYIITGFRMSTQPKNKGGSFPPTTH
jgi:hypothetical protein